MAKGGLGGTRRGMEGARDRAKENDHGEKGQGKRRVRTKDMGGERAREW